jgi:hypothetical protein
MEQVNKSYRVSESVFVVVLLQKCVLFRSKNRAFSLMRMFTRSLGIFTALCTTKNKECKSNNIIMEHRNKQCKRGKTELFDFFPRTKATRRTQI